MSSTSARPGAGADPVVPPRDQGESEFTTILRRLVADTPGARAAALFDFEGETVDYAGRLDPYEVRVVAAHFQILLAEIRDLGGFPSPRQLRIAATQGAYVIHTLDANYSLLVIVHPRASNAVSDRVLRDAETRLAKEAGLEPSSRPCWLRVEVQRGQGRGSPILLRPIIDGHGAEAAWYAVDVLGALVGTTKREKGYRVRLDTGIELNLVCERSRLWFVDEPVI